MTKTAARIIETTGQNRKHIVNERWMTEADHSGDVAKMVANRAKLVRTPFRYRDGEIRDASGRQLMLLMASNCTKKFRDGVGRAVVGILNANEPREPSLSRDLPRLP